MHIFASTKKCKTHIMVAVYSAGVGEGGSMLQQVALLICVILVACQSLMLMRAAKRLEILGLTLNEILKQSATDDGHSGDNKRAPECPCRSSGE